MNTWHSFTDLAIRWVPLEGLGLEHCGIHNSSGDIRVKSAVIGECDGIRYASHYEVRLNDDWQVREFTVDGLDGRSLFASSPAPGEWRDKSGRELTALKGCIDIDLSFSPFTNTLPVRRTRFAKGEAREFTMLFVPWDTLDPIPDGQRYTCLEPGRFLYEEIDGSFSAEIEFDEYGLVRDYQHMFRRID